MSRRKAKGIIEAVFDKIIHSVMKLAVTAVFCVCIFHLCVGGNIVYKKNTSGIIENTADFMNTGGQIVGKIGKVVKWIK